MSDVVTVIFLGLICHMDLGTNNTAVLPVAKNPLHKSVLAIFKPIRDYYDITALPIDGKRVHILGSTLESPIHDPSFDQNVPPIGRISGCTEDHELNDAILDVTRVKKSNDVNAYVDYEGDRLEAYDSFDDRIRFNGSHDSTWSHYHSAAFATGLISTPSSKNSMYLTIEDIGSGGAGAVRYDLPDGAFVIVYNAPDDKYAVVHDHFHHYFKLLSRCPNHQPIPTQVEKKTKRKRKVNAQAFGKKLISKIDIQIVDFIRRLNLNVECADSQYP